MSFASYCLCHQQDAAVRLRALEVRLKRQRIARERAARLWRLWWDVEQQSPWVT